jgi:AAA+ ATPase superfamily predicted ATPase
MNKFYGRQMELGLFNNEKNKKDGSLYVVKGRRRIGKSELIKQIAKINNFKLIIIQGISNIKGNNKKLISSKKQIDNFCELVRISLNINNFSYNNWNEAFYNLSKLTNDPNQRTLLLLDEISWMAQDNDGLLECFKTMWDDYFKNQNVCIFMCGSVSSWIKSHILLNTAFEGRISKGITLEELPIKEAKLFWEDKSIDPKIKLKTMCVTGGVSKYLEMIDPNKTAEQNIQELCFNRTGFLYKEFDKIFNDSFNKKSTLYRKILNILINKGKCKKTEILKELNITSDENETFNELIEGGYLKQESNFSFNPENIHPKDIFYSIKDNYTLFYLKYIESNKFRIEKNLYKNDKSLEGYSQWNTVSGLIFENLIRNNIEPLLNKINLSLTAVYNYSTFVGRKDKLNNKGFQIDLLIEDKNHNLFLCEFKMKNKIGLDTKKQVQNKIDRLSKKIDKKIFPIKILVYSGNLTEELVSSNYFNYLINFEDFFI